METMHFCTQINITKSDRHINKSQTHQIDLREDINIQHQKWVENKTDHIS